LPSAKLEVLKAAVQRVATRHEAISLVVKAISDHRIASDRE
jgi:hypothetical protein